MKFKMEKMKEKRALLAYGYSAKNAGDLAICVGAIDLLVEQGYKVIVLSKYNKNDSEFESSKFYYKDRYENNVKVLEAPFTLNRNANIIKKISLNFQGALIYLGFNNHFSKQLKKEIKNADIVIFNGGNLLRCSSIIDYIRLIALNYPLKLAKKYNKKYIIFPHSTAHINSLGKGIIGKMVKGAEMVFAREEISSESLKTTFNLTNIHSSLDLAYFIDNKKHVQVKKTSEIKSIAFTFRVLSVGDIQEFSVDEKLKVQRAIIDLIKTLGINNNYVFVIQTTKDKGFTLTLKRIVEDLFKCKVSIYENYDPDSLIEFYSKIDLLVGMRLHSIILATSVGTPAYGMFYKEWGLKNPGLMEKLGLDYIFVDDTENVDIDKIKFAINDRENFQERVRTLINFEKEKLIEIL